AAKREVAEGKEAAAKLRARVQALEGEAATLGKDRAARDAATAKEGASARQKAEALSADARQKAEALSAESATAKHSMQRSPVVAKLAMQGGREGGREGGKEGGGEGADTAEFAEGDEASSGVSGGGAQEPWRRRSRALEAALKSPAALAVKEKVASLEAALKAAKDAESAAAKLAKQTLDAAVKAGKDAGEQVNPKP
ncbi:hypothetical protein T484DRAFT_1766083, partial [Baffinella frigidus]